MAGTLKMGEALVLFYSMMEGIAGYKKRSSLIFTSESDRFVILAFLKDSLSSDY